MYKKELLSQQTKFKELKTNNDIILNKSSNEISNFRSRTLKTREIDDNILSEDVIFYAFGFCKSCNEYISLINLCSDLAQLKTKNEEGKDYFKCPNKHQKSNNDYLQFKLMLNFGVELFNLKLKSKNKSTSCSYSVDLLSPTTMKKRLLKIAKDLGENKFNIEMFKKNYKDLFWNLVWFFELNNMDVSFMLPYTYESCNILNDNQSERIKKAVIKKYKKEQDIDIEKIVKNTDLNVSIIFYGKVKAFGKKLDQEEIKNNVFTSIKTKYSLNDLVEQKIFQFQINNKIGMISYMGFNSFSENIGYNEYPVQFEEIQIPDESLFMSVRSNINHSISYGNICLDSSIPYSNMSINDKKISFNPVNNNNKLQKIKSVNFADKPLQGSSNAKKLTKGGGILKKSSKNVIINTDVEISNKIEDIDFLSKFKESQKKIENALKGENKVENKDKADNKSLLRKSTLKNGILFENKKESNALYRNRRR